MYVLKCRFSVDFCLSLSIIKRPTVVVSYYRFKTGSRDRVTSSLVIGKVVT